MKAGDFGERACIRLRKYSGDETRAAKLVFSTLTMDDPRLFCSATFSVTSIPVGHAFYFEVYF